MRPLFLLAVVMWALAGSADATTITYDLADEGDRLGCDLRISDAEQIVGYVATYRYDPEVLEPEEPSVPEDAVLGQFPNKLTIAQVSDSEPTVTISVVLVPDGESPGEYAGSFAGSGKLGRLSFWRLRDDETLLAAEEVAIWYANDTPEYFLLDISVPAKATPEPPVTTTTVAPKRQEPDLVSMWNGEQCVNIDARYKARMMSQGYQPVRNCPHRDEDRISSVVTASPSKAPEPVGEDLRTITSKATHAGDPPDHIGFEEAFLMVAIMLVTVIMIWAVRRVKGKSR